MPPPDLIELDHLPDGLLERPASALHHHFQGPALITLRGRLERPLLVSVLQHGNEITGWEAVRRLLKSPYLVAGCPASAAPPGRPTRFQPLLARRQGH
jgi:succinylglutamate desuccinylase